MAQTTIRDLKPIGVILDGKQTENLASYIKSCKVAEKNLETVKKHFSICSEEKAGEETWWQSPMGVISIGLSSLVMGLAIGAQ